MTLLDVAIYAVGVFAGWLIANINYNKALDEYRRENADRAVRAYARGKRRERARRIDAEIALEDRIEELEYNNADLRQSYGKLLREKLEKEYAE